MGRVVAPYTHQVVVVGHDVMQLPVIFVDVTAGFAFTASNFDARLATAFKLVPYENKIVVQAIRYQ